MDRIYTSKRQSSISFNPTIAHSINLTKHLSQNTYKHPKDKSKLSKKTPFFLLRISALKTNNAQNNQYCYNKPNSPKHSQNTIFPHKSITQYFKGRKKANKSNQLKNKKQKKNHKKEPFQAIT